MHNKRIKITIIVGVIYLVLLLSIDVIKVLNDKPISKNDVITTMEVNTEASPVSPRTEEETSEVTESTTINPETTTNGNLEENTTGSTVQTKPNSTTTRRTTTTTTKPIPGTINCSNRQIINSSREEILSKIGHAYNSNTCLKWNGFIKGRNDTYDGSIPTEWLNDPIYLSMAMPGESKSEYMVSVNRDNAHVMGVTEDKLRNVQVAIGAVYKTMNGSLPSSYTINYGKIKLFGYSKSKKKWVILDFEPHPLNVVQYQLPWTAHLPTTDYTKKFVDHGSYVSITYNNNDIDDTHLMHFWGRTVYYDKSDYLYYASAYEVWTSTPAAVGGLTATSGIDTKDKPGAEALQLYSSYGMKVTTSRKVLWGHTIPMNEYDYYRDSVQLQNLFNLN